MKPAGLIKIFKLPVLIGIFAPLLALFLGITLINQARQYQSSANSDKAPIQMKIGNVTDQSVTVSWTTAGLATGSIMYGLSQNQLDRISLDVRDAGTENQTALFNHYVLINNLPANTEIFFKIQSSGMAFDNQGQPFSTKTSPKITPPDSDIAQGRILNPDNTPANGALVYLNLANTIPQIALTDEDGRWMIPLSTARLTDLSALSAYDRNSQVIDLIAQDGQQTATASITTKNDNPTPDIVLGQTYNFVGQPLPTQPSQRSNGLTDQTIPDNNQDQSQTTGAVEDLQIIYPAASENINNQIPEFIGVGPAGQEIEITVHSSEAITGSTKIANDNKWRWSPTTPLSPGEHTVTVSYTDEDGFVKKATKSFIVTAAQAAENEFLPSFTATGSAQTATPIPTLIPTTTLIPTSVPTLAASISPTQSPTLAPTATTAERTSIPADQGEVPTSGNLTTTLVVGGVGLLVVIAGLVFLIF